MRRLNLLPVFLNSLLKIISDSCCCGPGLDRGSGVVDGPGFDRGFAPLDGPEPNGENGPVGGGS